MPSLSRAVLMAIRDRLLDPHQEHKWSTAVLADMVDRALRTKRGVKVMRAAKKKRDAQVLDAWEVVKAAVRKRAGGRCEACGRDLRFAKPSSVDHFYGGNGRRRAMESVETCWELDGQCHEDKGANKPNASYWLVKFIEHCLRHGYMEAAELAQKRLDSLGFRQAMSSTGFNRDQLNAEAEIRQKWVRDGYIVASSAMNARLGAAY